jgi:hypothetical protein
LGTKIRSIVQLAPGWTTFSMGNVISDCGEMTTVDVNVPVVVVVNVPGKMGAQLPPTGMKLGSGPVLVVSMFPPAKKRGLLPVLVMVTVRSELAEPTVTVPNVTGVGPMVAEVLATVVAFRASCTKVPLPVPRTFRMPDWGPKPKGPPVSGAKLTCTVQLSEPVPKASRVLPLQVVLVIANCGAPGVIDTPGAASFTECEPVLVTVTVWSGLWSPAPIGPNVTGDGLTDTEVVEAVELPESVTLWVPATSVTESTASMAVETVWGVNRTNS